MITAFAFPVMLQLTRAKDAWTRVDALEALAYLQDTQVIPAIGRAAENGGLYANTAAYSLFHYRNADAVPLLIPQMRNKNPQARMFVIEAFDGLKDRRTVPSLIAATDDPDGTVRGWALYVLHEIMGLPKDYFLGTSAKQENSYVQFWRDWRVSHSSEMEQMAKPLAH